MKLYKMVVSSMTATYTGYRMANSAQEAIDNLRAEYKMLHDDRASWNITAKEVKDSDEEE